MPEIFAFGGRSARVDDAARGIIPRWVIALAIRHRRARLAGLFLAAVVALFGPGRALAVALGPSSIPTLQSWMTLGPKMEENFYAVLVGLMVILVAFAFAYHRSAQLSRLREVILRTKDQELDFQKLAMDEHSIVNITDVNGDIIYVNQKFAEISGYPASELIGQNTRRLNSGEHSEAHYHALWRTVLDGNIWRGELRNRKKNGGFYWVKATIVPFLNSAGKPEKFISICTDITRNKAAERAIRQFKSTLDLTDDMIFMFWPDTLEFFYLNRAARDSTGWGSGDIGGKTPAEANPNFDLEVFKKQSAPLLAGEKTSTTYEAIGLRNQPIEIKLQLIEPNGEKPRFVAFIRDITARKATQNQLLQFKTTLENIEDAVYMFWPDTCKFFYVNEAALKMDGLRADEIIGQTPAALNPDYCEAEFRARLELLVSGSRNFVTYETSHARKSGGSVPVEVRLQYMEPHAEAPRFVAFARDISERKAAENQIEQFKATLDYIEDPVYMFWPDTLEFIYVNQAALDLSGLKQDEMLGKTPAVLSPDFDLAEFRMRCKPLIFGLKNAVKYETCHLNAKGELVPFEALLQIIEPEREEPRFVAIARDISERREVDRAKSEFVSTVSHELRTPLTSIKGALGLMRSGAVGKMPKPAEKLLKIAADNSDRLVSLINDILDVEKGEAGMIDLHLAHLDLTRLVENAIEANQGYADQYDVHFRLVSSSAAVMVEGDEGRLMQVMANLMSNAAKFSDRGGEVEISLELASDMVRLAVRDFGAGIPEVSQATIFEKFTQADSSDKRQTGGTGLGLSIARSIIQGHGGVLDFVSKEGVGTTFFINMKCLPQQLASDQDRSAAGTVSGRILVVDDNPEFSASLQQLLKDAGHEVSSATTAARATEMLEIENFDCMTLDIGLPDKDGLSLLKELRRSGKAGDMPVIVVSAVAKSRKNRRGATGIGVIDWIQKPVDEKILSARIEYAIRQAAGDRPSVLHVEDEQGIRDIVKEIVAERANITSAGTIASARAWLEKRRFDLVILDLTLPDGRGECLLEMMNRPPQQATPVVIFSAREVSDRTAEQVRAALLKSQASNSDLLDVINASIRKRLRPAA